jgi:hypothetical protein
MGITLDRLVFDTTAPDNGANVGAFLRGSDGTLITQTGGALDVNIAGSTGLGIFAEDSAHSSGDLGQQILAVRKDVAGSLVSADGDYAPLQVDSTGALRVAAEVTVQAGDAEFLEDSAHTTGDAGLHMLAVRQDALSSLTSADGDYASFKSDALGRLYMNRSGQSAAYGAVSISNTATDIIATDLTNRIKVIVQNISNKDVFIGSNNSVTTANGVRLSSGSSVELEVGAGVNLHGITSSGTADVRYFEVA